MENCLNHALASTRWPTAVSPATGIFCLQAPELPRKSDSAAPERRTWYSEGGRPDRRKPPSSDSSQGPVSSHVRDVRCVSSLLVKDLSMERESI